MCQNTMSTNCKSCKLFHSQLAAALHSQNKLEFQQVSINKILITCSQCKVFSDTLEQSAYVTVDIIQNRFTH